jgi:SAM-dependent methyltransferase
VRKLGYFPTSARSEGGSTTKIGKADGQIRLHLGCGVIAPPGWINIDGSWNARLAKHPVLRRTLHALRVTSADKIQVPWNPEVLIHDLRKPLPFDDDYATAIYSSHMLEHLYFQEGQRFLRECFRTLAEGGVLRIVVPDLRSIVLDYLAEQPFPESSNGFEGTCSADRLNQRLLLRSPIPPSRNFFYRLYSSWKDFHSHKWMYDANSVKHHLGSAGFIEVQEMKLHQSRIDGIELVEDPSRVLKGEGICIEGIKPVAGTAVDRN